MKMTPKRAAVILAHYNELHELARQFADEKRKGMRTGPVRFDDCGNIEMKVNTACHCHPEYEWVSIGDSEEFAEWLDKNQ